MLQVSQLSYTLDSKKILDDVTFKIETGDFVGLIGPNGSGKTTLLKILSGVYRDYQGKALLNLMPVNEFNPRGMARFISVVPQEAHFSFSFSSLEVVLMGRFPYQRRFAFESPEDIQIAKMAMQKTDCLQFADRPIDSLSGGEKQRVLLARALAQKTKILLLDEPASHLDLQHQQDLFRLLKDLNQTQKLTIICVVHDLNMASLYCQKIFMLKEGQLLFQGNTSEVMNSENIEEVFQVLCEPVKDQKGRVHWGIVGRISYIVGRGE